VPVERLVLPVAVVVAEVLQEGLVMGRQGQLGLVGEKVQVLVVTEPVVSASVLVEAWELQVEPSNMGAVKVVLLGPPTVAKVPVPHLKLFGELLEESID